MTTAPFWPSIKRGLVAFVCSAIVLFVIPKLGAYGDMTVSAVLFAIVHWLEKTVVLA